jgi:hypothetical protein
MHTSVQPQAQPAPFVTTLPAEMISAPVHYGAAVPTTASTTVTTDGGTPLGGIYPPSAAPVPTPVMQTAAYPATSEVLFGAAVAGDNAIVSDLLSKGVKWDAVQSKV